MESESVGIYLYQCAKQNIKSQEDILAKTRKDYEEYDEKIREFQVEIEALKLKKNVLLQVLKSFSAPIKERKIIVPLISDLLNMEELNQDQLQLLIRCCVFLDAGWNQQRQIKPTNVMTGLQVKTEQDAVVYSMIKWLGMKNIIKRDGEFLIPGENWEKRPK